MAHPNSPLRTIGIFTLDYRLIYDITRVLRQLRSLGVYWTVSYRIGDVEDIKKDTTIWVAPDGSDYPQEPTVAGVMDAQHPSQW
jgi:hypothetical protein